MDLILRALRFAGFSSEAAQISLRWREALAHGHTEPGANYHHCYPDELLDLVCARACEGFSDIGCRQAQPGTTDPIHIVLNESWARFWRDPSGYHAWEKDEVEKLLDLCRGPAAATSKKSTR